jgi:hypothetical protein
MYQTLLMSPAMVYYSYECVVVFDTLTQAIESAYDDWFQSHYEWYRSICKDATPDVKLQCLHCMLQTFEGGDFHDWEGGCGRPDDQSLLTNKLLHQI